MGNLPTALTVEVQFSGTTWTDLSDFVAGEIVSGGEFLRPTDPAGPPVASTWQVTLRNDGRFTPDNPTSPYYPSVLEGLRIRVSGTVGVISFQRFTGRITSWAPLFNEGSPSDSAVLVTAVDDSAQLRLDPLKSSWTEANLKAIRDLGGASWTDSYQMDSAALENIGVRNGSGSNPTGSGLIARQTGASVVFGESEGANLDGAVTLTGIPVRTESGMCKSMLGPVLKFTPTGLPYSISFWVKVKSDDIASGAGHATYGGFLGIDTPPTGEATNDQTGSVVCAWYAFDGRLIDALAIRETHYSGAPPANTVTEWVAAGFPQTAFMPVVGDDWAKVTISVSGPNTNIGIAYLSGAGGSYALPASVSSASRVVIGGLIDGTSGPREIQIGPVEISSRATTSSQSLANPEATTTPAARLTELFGYRDLTYSTTGLASTPAVVRTDTTGRPVWDAITEVAQSVQAEVAIDGTGTYRVTWSSALTGATPNITLSAEQDLAGAPSWIRDADRAPTRVTVRGPLATSTVVGDESRGVRDGGTVETCLASSSDMQLLAQALLAQTGPLRIDEFTVDLSTMTTTGYATLLNLGPGARARITDLPSLVIGRTYLDVYIVGRREQWTVSGVILTFKCVTAEAVVMGRLDSSEAGRYASPINTAYYYANGGSVFVGNGLGTGTMTVQTVGGLGFTTDPAMYPMDLDWNGERVTASGATSGTSLTISARGVAPSVARVHTQTERISVWQDPEYGY